MDVYKNYNELTYENYNIEQAWMLKWVWADLNYMKIERFT